MEDLDFEEDIYLDPPKEIKFYLAGCPLKEAKKKYCTNKDLFIIDILKIIRDHGYDPNDLTKESEFLINYSITKKIKQGIYNTKHNGILLVNKKISQTFVENLKHFLQDLNREIIYEIEIL